MMMFHCVVCRPCSVKRTDSKPLATCNGNNLTFKIGVLIYKTEFVVQAVLFA